MKSGGMMLALGAVVLALHVNCTPPPDSITTADAIYFNGEIITVNDNEPNAEALAVRAGRIISVGSMSDVERTRAASTRMIDLRGLTLLPSFIDPYSHYLNSLLIANQVNVFAPPAGPGKDIPAIVAELKRFREERKIKQGELIQAYGYDESLMPNGIGLTRDDLDADFPDNPVVVGLASMRGAVLNSAALKKYGITADTKTPLGGVILRKPDSTEPTGLVLDSAYLPIRSQLPKLSTAQGLEWSKAGQMFYAQAGITTAQEGAAHAADLEIMQSVATAGENIIDIVAYPDVTDFEAILAKNPVGNWGYYNGRLKLGGGQITLDGTSQNKTAFFSTPYLTGGPGGEKEWKGQPAASEESISAFVKKLYDLNLQVLILAQGDAAIDLALRAHELAAPDSLDKDRRTIVVSEFARPDQLDKFLAYKLIPSFQTEHIYFYGDTDILSRGEEQTVFVCPLNAALNKGLSVTNNTNFAFAPLDQMLLVWTAVNRISRNGNVIGPQQRVTALEAIKAITINAAYQYHEEDLKGSLEPGKFADLVILDQNPLRVDPGKIKDIKVMETIKEGKTIYIRQD